MTSRDDTKGPIRIRILPCGKGYGFAYEKRDGKRWRTVEIRRSTTGQQPWSLEEAHRRGRTVAELVGGRLHVPLKILQRPGGVDGMLDVIRDMDAERAEARP